MAIACSSCFPFAEGLSYTDYADATLILLAEYLGVFDLLTLDRRGFSAFRSSHGKHFSLVLDQA